MPGGSMFPRNVVMAMIVLTVLVVLSRRLATFPTESISIPSLPLKIRPMVSDLLVLPVRAVALRVPTQLIPLGVTLVLLTVRRTVSVVL